jgi:hypothetical protein
MVVVPHDWRLGEVILRDALKFVLRRSSDYMDMLPVQFAYYVVQEHSTMAEVIRVPR